jgi:hypothetical protein
MERRATKEARSKADVIRVVLVSALAVLFSSPAAEALGGPTPFLLGPAFADLGGTVITVDIHPGNDATRMNPRSRGRVPVAILTTAAFDATTVDLDSVELGPDRALPYKTTLEDVDGDGDLDAVLHYWAMETGVGCGASAATLRGHTDSGQSFRGTDSVRTGCR